MSLLHTTRVRLHILTALALAAILGASLVNAHGDDDNHGMGHMGSTGKLPEEAKFFHWPDEPMGWALRVHIALSLIGFVVLLPIALVMEMARHRYHPLVQLSGAVIGFLGIVFGWVNGHLDNTYARFGWFMLCLLLVQTAANVGFYIHVLKRSSVNETLYRVTGLFLLVFTYTAMVLGGIRYLNLCTQGHLGQCISHFARGSALIMGSVVFLVFVRVFGPLMLEIRRPPEFYISLIMVTVGLIGTFTEHNFFQSASNEQESWSHKDLQHTMIGIAWFAGGLLGVLMTAHSHPRFRTPIPSIIFIATGISMIIHQQDVVMSSRVHFFFGAAQVLLGLSTICEITLVASGFVKDRGEPPFFQYVPLFFMCASGMALMGANRDMVFFLINSEIDISTYALVLLSFCFVIVFYFYLLVDFYNWLTGTTPSKYSALSDEDVDVSSGWLQREEELRRKRHSTSSQTSTLNHSESDEHITPQTFEV
ncbi:hypothetical protein LPJ64_003397 [Coemansia asiatica]|uniref:Uncharacterized protein n=1 Tax=Coemansia asiatica TaxID=1052880 RepID=A0A9W7XL45_9FUNG|nr:hypothetical protein LPJ64_003397 [Coemansia asiatica]